MISFLSGFKLNSTRDRTFFGLLRSELSMDTLLEKGLAVLSDQELPAVILGKGNRNEDVLSLADRASAIIVAHNHPSGSLQPSPEDIRITGQLKEAGSILGVPLLDHIIFSSRGYYSLAEHNDL
jgi:DNA repair protein RadC